MRLNRTGYGLIAVWALVAAGSIAAGIATADAVLLLVGGGAAVAVLALIVFALISARRGRRDRRLFETGIRGRGTIVRARPGMAIEDGIRVTLVMELEVPGVEPRREVETVLVSSFVAPCLRPGVVLPVYVDPEDDRRVLVAW